MTNTTGYSSDLTPTEWDLVRNTIPPPKDANPVDVSKPVKISLTDIGIGSISVKAEPVSSEDKK